DEMSLRWCQGTWVVVRKESVGGGRKEQYDWGITHVRIQGDRWTLMRDGQEVVSYTIAIDGAPRPGHIDWFSLDQPQSGTLWTGLIKREGHQVLILYNSDPRKQRARDFDSARAGSFVITVRRGG